MIIRSCHFVWWQMWQEGLIEHVPNNNIKYSNKKRVIIQEKQLLGQLVPTAAHNINQLCKEAYAYPLVCWHCWSCLPICFLSKSCDWELERSRHGGKINEKLTRSSFYKLLEEHRFQRNLKLEFFFQISSFFDAFLRQNDLFQLLGLGMNTMMHGQPTLNYSKNILTSAG